MKTIATNNKFDNSMQISTSSKSKQTFAKKFSRLYHTWSTLPWVLMMLAGFASQFWLGYHYNSNETTNIYLQVARGCSYTLLLALCLLWLPVMRHGLAALWRSRWTAWLPLEQAKNIHRWLGHLLLTASLIHGGGYLLYFNTLEAPFIEVVLGTESDLVRSMKTTMYEFVSEDESIDEVNKWIDNGMPKDDYHDIIRPIMKEDCSKCHSASSTMTYAIPSLPLSYYDEVKSLGYEGVFSRQFRINMCGIIMLLLLIPLWFTSLRFMRQRHHHLFQHLHKLGYLMVILALFHIPRYNWLIVPTVILAVEYFLSHYIRLYRGQLANIHKVSDNILRLEMPRPDGFDIKAGHYLQLRVPALKRYEWHDFSLTGIREDKDVIVLKIKAMGDWTDKLMELFGNDDSTNIVVDIRGPFASPAARVTKEDQWLMVAGGIGITPFLGLLHTMLFHSSTIKQFHLIWVLRDNKLLTWLEPFLTSPIFNRVTLHIYLTRDNNNNELPDWLAKEQSNERISLLHERPNWENLFTKIAQELQQPHCFVCGPNAMTNAVKVHCRQKGWSVSIERF